MKRYRFRLETVLRVRRIQSDVARAELGAAVASVARRTQTLELRKVEYGPAGARITEAVTPLWMREAEIKARRAEAIVGAHHSLQDAHAFKAEKHRAWTIAEQRVSALERLDDRRREEHRLETDKAVEVEVDDVVVSRWSH